MAVNVFLTFQTTKMRINLQKMEKWYVLFCYGVPAVPALFYLIMDYTRKTDYYGDATIWCWVSKDHDSLRMITFYGPVWIVLVITMALYAITGRAIFKGQVRNVHMRNALGPEADAVLSRNPPANFDLSTLTKKTAICQVSERAVSPSNASSATLAISVLEAKEKRAITPISISAPIPMPKPQPRHRMIEIPCFGNGSFPPGCAISGPTGSLPNFSVTTTVTAAPITPTESTTSSPVMSSPEFNSLRAPERITRFSVVSNQSTVSNVPSAYGAGLQPTRSRLAYISQRFGSVSRPVTSRTNRGARQYARVALLLYIAMLIVWVPSTVNRAWGIANAKKNEVNFTLNLAAAAVLPTQGLFNALVFCFTSRVELLSRIRELMRWFGGDKRQPTRQVQELDYRRTELKSKTKNWDWPLITQDEKVEEREVEEV
jgi:hypothetical protein